MIAKWARRTTPSTGTSLMPEGLKKALSLQDLSNLLE